MGIRDIQETWGRLSANSSERLMLNEEQIKAMLGKRSKSLMERIDFNIRIGFFVLLGIILLIFSYDFYNSSAGLNGGRLKVEIPGWLLVIDYCTDILMAAIFIAFFYQYSKIRRFCKNGCDLRHSLLKVIGILTQYQRLFTVALVIVMLSSATGFIAGYYTSIHLNRTSEGFLIPVIMIGILLIALITCFLFLLLRGLFRKVYGNYLAQLRETLAELDELEE